jgi:hypothetical protein
VIGFAENPLEIALISALTLFISLNIASSFAVTTPAQCQTANLSLGLGDRISPATGEHGEVYILTNLGKTVCQLRGYPGISLYDSKHRILPFRYIRGAGQWVTHAVPKIVVLHPGSDAFFFVAKYRCDIGIVMVAATVRVYPPNGTRQLIGPASGDAGVSDLAYCMGGTKDRLCIPHRGNRTSRLSGDAAVDHAGVSQ